MDPSYALIVLVFFFSMFLYLIDLASHYFHYLPVVALHSLCSLNQLIDLVSYHFRLTCIEKFRGKCVLSIRTPTPLLIVLTVTLDYNTRSLLDYNLDSWILTLIELLGHSRCIVSCVVSYSLNMCLDTTSLWAVPMLCL